MTSPDTAAPWDVDDATSERAADFFARRRFGEWSDEDQAAFDAWFAKSALHRVAYLRLQGAVAHTEDLVAFAPNEFRATVAVRRDRAVRNRFLLPLLVAASAALVIAFGASFATHLLQPPDRAFSTDVGGRTTLKFADGTEVALDTDTAMRFRMTTSERTVWLDKGEAWFHVAHDTAKPFTVVIGTHRVVDVGTEFLVRREDLDVEVALLNGLAMLKTQGTATTMLAPGDDAVATSVSTSVTRKTPQELADALAWRRGMLVFRNRTLADVAREINRYNSTKLVIADPSVAGIRISTELKSDDYEGFVRVAESALNLRANREGNQILITRGQQDPAKRPVRTKHSP